MCVISIKNITTAHRAKRILSKEAITVNIVSIDPSLTQKGCAYGISFNCNDSTRVKKILRHQGIDHGDITV